MITSNGLRPQNVLPNPICAPQAKHFRQNRSRILKFSDDSSNLANNGFDNIYGNTS